MIADSTDADNMEQNKVIIYRITSKHMPRKTWVRKKRQEKTSADKIGNADKSSNPAMMNELLIILSLLLPLKWT